MPKFVENIMPYRKDRAIVKHHGRVPDYVPETPDVDKLVGALRIIAEALAKSNTPIEVINNVPQTAAAQVKVNNEIVTPRWKKLKLTVNRDLNSRITDIDVERKE